MPRIARAVAIGIPHHVTQRGNNQQDVFFTDDDRKLYLDLLHKNARQYGLQVWAYCLMSNHVHLIVVPQQIESLAKAIGRTHYLFTRYINIMHGRSGHLWQNRFFSCVLDTGHCTAAMRYVEQNPVRSGMVKKAWKYNWSSCKAHITGTDAIGVIDMKGSPVADIGSEQWKKLVSETADEGILSGIRNSTRVGRPLGTDKFISKLEVKIGRRLRALPVGRPGKHKKDNLNR